MTEEKNSIEIDLSNLKNFDFSKNWDVNKNNKVWAKKETKRERSEPKIQKKQTNKNQDKKPEHYKVTISPNKTVLGILKAEIKKSGKSYGVEEIMTTISEKLDRLQIKIEYFNPTENNNFYKTVFDNSIFSTKKKALKHILENGLDKIIEIKKEEGEKPNGIFNTILKCGITGKFLPPKNYHNFEGIVRNFIFHNKITVGFDKYIESLKKIEDPESVKSWMETPLTNFTYEVVKNTVSVQKINNLDQLILLMNDLKNGYIRKSEHITIRGENLETLEKDIRILVNDIIKTSRKWRKDMFFNILINLKKSGFCIFKHGENKHLFACYAKAKKVQDNKLSATCDQIIKKINAFNNIKKSALMEKLLEKNIEKKTVIREIHWLLKEGYIREFSNGNLTIS
jgi:hypothetical protein